MAAKRDLKGLKAAAERAGKAPTRPKGAILDELPENLREGLEDDITTQAQIRVAMSRLFRATVTGKIALAQATRYTFLLAELAKALEREVEEKITRGTGGAGFQGLRVIGPPAPQPTKEIIDVGSDGRRAGDGASNGTERSQG